MSLLQSMTSGISAATGSSNEEEQQPTADTQNVADEVANITSQNSLAMRSAAAQGKVNAAKRGLENSTIGIEASQRAMLDAALPMAQQNVSQRFEADQTQLNRDWESEQAALNRGHDITMQEEQVRANTVGEYFNTLNDLTTGFFDAYADIQNSEMKASDKSNAVAQLKKDRDALLASLRNEYQSMRTTEANWSDFEDLM